MASTTMKYLGIGVERDALNLDRRRVPVEPYAVVRVATPGGAVRSIPMDEDALAEMLCDAAEALRNIRRIRKSRAND